MKKIIFKSLFAAVIGITLSGCASYGGSMLSPTSLNSANFTYVKENISNTLFNNNCR